MSFTVIRVSFTDIYVVPQANSYHCHLKPLFLMKRQLLLLLFALMGSLSVSAQNVEALYDEGKALYDAKKYVEAIAKLKPAAEKGHKKAQYRMGRCYDKGNGVEEDNVEAVRWYAKAAEQGYAKAEYQMARAYLKGKGGLKVDTKKAKALLKKAVGGKKHGQEILDEIKQKAAEGDEEYKQLLELL